MIFQLIMIYLIDTFGNIKTKGSLEIDSSIKNIISGELEVNSGITSDNNSIILTADGNLTIASKFVSKDNGTFTNNFFLQDSSLQNFMQMSTDADCYINLINNKILGIGTTVPSQLLHVNGSCQLGTDGSIVYINDILTINKKGFPDNLMDTSEAYTLNVGGDLNIAGNIYVQGKEFTPSSISGAVAAITALVENNSITSSGSFSGTGKNDSPWKIIDSTSTIYYTRGNVGIGTNSPTAPLHTTGNAKIGLGGNITLGDDTSQVYVGNTLLTDLVNGYWFISGNQNNNDNSEDSIYCSINNKSFVGIGVETPQYKLDISGTFHASDTVLCDNDVLIRKNLGVGTTDPSYLLDVNGDANIVGNLYVNGVKYETPDQSLNVFWISNSDQNIYFLNDVGIGLDTPSYKLHVVGESYFSGNSNFDSNVQMSELNIEVQFTVGNNQFIIDTVNKITYNNELLYTNNYVGDLPNYSYVMNNNSNQTIKFIPNNKFIQKISSTQNLYGIGTTTNGLMISNDGSSEAAIVPFGTFYNSYTQQTNYNGGIQTYKWDSKNKTWYFINNLGAANTGTQNSSIYSQSFSINNDGNFIAMSTKA